MVSSRCPQEMEREGLSFFGARAKNGQKWLPPGTYRAALDDVRWG